MCIASRSYGHDVALSVERCSMQDNNEKVNEMAKNERCMNVVNGEKYGDLTESCPSVGAVKVCIL